MTFVPCLVRSMDGSELVSITLGHPLVDGYLEFVGARGAVNTWLAVAYDLKVFFEVVAKEPAEVAAARRVRVLGGAARAAPWRAGGADRGRRAGVGGAHDRPAACRAWRACSSICSRVAMREWRRNPVPRGLAGRRAGRRGRGGVRLVRTPRTLPRVLSPGEVDRLLGALRTRRDRAMVFAMLLGGLAALRGARACASCDVSVGERRVHITCGKGGRERIVPVSGRFFAALGEYLELERPAESATEACFVVLKGPRRGLPLSPSGLDEVLDGAPGARGARAVHVSSAAAYVLDAGCVSRGWHWRRCRRRPGTRRSSPRGSICISRTTGWRASISPPRRRSTRSLTRSPGSARREPPGARPGGGGAGRRVSRLICRPPACSRRTRSPRPRGRSCCASDRDGFTAMTLDQQLAVWGHDRRLVAWLIVTGRVAADGRLPGREQAAGRKGRSAASTAEFHGRFLEVAGELGFEPKAAELQWWAVAKVAALAGVAPERLTKAQLDTGRATADRTRPRRLHPDHPMRSPAGHDTVASARRRRCSTQA